MFSNKQSFPSGRISAAFDTARDIAVYNDQHPNQRPVCKTGFERVTYTWEHLVVSADQDGGNCFKFVFNKSKGHKLLLKNVSGVVKPGEFLAIMGASGAGKTTLLNCLTFRNTGKLKVTGRRCINGIPVDTDSLASISAYVQQDELFINTLTVREHLKFQALLRMDKHLSYTERMNRVDEVMEDLGLINCANTIIGNAAKGSKGISGGERKRLAFASEVLTNPPLMFCDEPTSGLDSYMAQNIVKAMKNLAAAGKTVICTFHQPSSEVFELFDRILLMAEGRTAYLGPMGQALNFFAERGLACPANYNPADFYIYNLAVVPGQEQASRNKIEEICNAYELSDDGSSIAQLLKINRNSFGDETTLLMQQNRSPYKANWWTQFTAVLWRSWISIVKDPRVPVVEGISARIIAVLVALIYRGQEPPTDSKDIPGYIQNIQGVLFLFLTNATFESLFGIINVFAGEVPIFLREHFNGMYRTEVYFISKFLVELPIYIISPFISFAIPYYAIGLNAEVGRFFIGAGVMILVTNVAISFGYFVSCLTSSVELATALGARMIIPLMLFGGFFLNNGQVPVYLDWLRYLSWFMYSNEALTINQWQGVRFNTTECSANKSIPLITCTGEDVIKQFEFKSELFNRDIGCLVALIVGFRLLAFLALLAQTRRKT